MAIESPAPGPNPRMESLEHGHLWRLGSPSWCGTSLESSESCSLKCFEMEKSCLGPNSFCFFSLSMKKSKGWQWGGYHGYKHPSRESRGVPGPYYFNEQMSTLSWQGQLKWPHVLQQKSVHLWWLCLKYFSTFPRLLVCCFAKCMLLLAHWRRTRVWER